MLEKYLVAPSVNSLFVTGFLLLSIFYIFIMNYKTIIRVDVYKKLILLSTIAIAVGIHGLIHLGVEDEYDLNPYKWF